MPSAWLRYYQDIVLAAFVAGLSVAEMQLRMVESALPSPRRRDAIRLVSDLYGILIEGPS